MDIYDILKKNNFLFTEKETKKLLKTNDYKLIMSFSKDENFLVYVPYIPLQITSNFK